MKRKLIKKMMMVILTLTLCVSIVSATVGAYEDYAGTGYTTDYEPYQFEMTNLISRSKGMEENDIYSQVIRAVTYDYGDGPFTDDEYVISIYTGKEIRNANVSDTYRISGSTVITFPKNGEELYGRGLDQLLICEKFLMHNVSMSVQKIENEEWSSPVIAAGSTITLSGPGCYLLWIPQPIGVTTDFALIIVEGDYTVPEITVNPELNLSVSPIADEYNPNITVGNKLTWTDITEVSGYEVYRFKYDPNESTRYFHFLAHVTGTAYIDVLIEANTEYGYLVSPDEDSIFNEVISNYVYITTGSESAPLLPDKDGIMGTANSYILMQIDNPMMNVNGKTIEVDPGRGTKPMLYKDRTMLPIRAVVEAMGGTVGWDGTDLKVTLAANGNTVVMWIGKMDYTINGAKSEMDVAPFMQNDRTFIPVRFSAQNLNCRVTWINATLEVLIVYNSGSSKG